MRREYTLVPFQIIHISLAIPNTNIEDTSQCDNPRRRVSRTYQCVSTIRTDDVKAVCEGVSDKGSGGDKEQSNVCVLRPRVGGQDNSCIMYAEEAIKAVCKVELNR